jgi:ATP-dependent DNA ligase
MSTFKLLDSIKSAKGSKAKKEILRSATDIDRKVFRLALDPSIVFYYQIHDQDIPDPSRCPYDDLEAISQFVVVAEQLSTGTIRGTTSVELVRYFLSGCSEHQQKWCQKILNKHLNVGVEAKTYLSVFPDEFVYYELQLCDKWTDEECKGWLVQPKFDGLRCVCVPTDQGYIALSRNGLQLFGSDHILEEFNQCHQEQKLIFDGELMGRRWNDSISNAKTQSNKTSQNYFHLFDVLTRQEWDSRLTKNPQSATLYNRQLRIQEFLRDNPNLSWVVAVNTVILGQDDTTNDMMQRYIDQGYEGCVLKNPLSQYRFKRTRDWLKHKPRETADLPIVEVLPGTSGSWCANMLGSIVVEYNGVLTNIGTGFEELDRIQLWELHQKGELVGRTAEIKYQSITDDGALLFASFKSIREDK